MCLYYTIPVDEMSIRETLILFGVTDEVKRYTKNASLEHIPVPLAGVFLDPGSCVAGQARACRQIKL